MVVLSAQGALRYFGCYGRGSAMRHFLIITCLAALTCAAAPVQAALAQAGSPIVESEAERSPEPNEEARGSTPLEEGGSKAEQNDKEQKDNGASLSLSDPLTIARFVVTPILLWILKNLVSYSFRRVHIARTIYVDVEYQLRFLDGAIDGLAKWLGDLRKSPKVISYIRLSPDRHYVYPSIQREILECMWGQEITAVRLFYRDMEQVERYAERISTSATTIFGLPPTHLLKRGAKVRNDFELNREIEVVDENLTGLRSIRNFWLDEVGNRKDVEGNVRYDAVASKLLYSRWVWHSIFTGAWSAFIVAVLVELFGFGPVGGSQAIWCTAFWMLVAAIFLLLIAIALKRISDNRVSRYVVEKYPSSNRKTSPT